ncbi:hypothetical protein [Ktedonospora formicarum]|nr:hypothetical protein [Ktedonospora formicarum]
MKVIFRSKDFASIDGAGFGFNHRRPMSAPWHYQGRVQHRNWQGTYECYWEKSAKSSPLASQELFWTVRGDARLFGLAAALKSLGLTVDVEQDN